MNWDDLRFFCAAASAPTLTEAARRLRSSTPTLSRRIDALEARLGTRLFDRTPEGIKLTAQGERLHAKARIAAAAMQEADRLAASLKEDHWPEPVRVSATEPVITEVLAPALPALLRQPGAPCVELVVRSDVVSLASREADLAVRFVKPEGESLVMRRVASLSFGLYAGAALLAGRDPAAIDLGALPVLDYDGAYGRIAEKIWLEQAGLVRNIVARSSSTRGLAMAVLAGAGIAVLPRLIAERQAGLVALAPPRPIPPRAVWLVAHRDLARVAALRLTRDWIADAFRGLPDAARGTKLGGIIARDA